MATATVTAELLTAFEDALRDADVPLVDRLQPGASGHELDRVEQQLGVPLASEVRTWWAWHNGVAGEPGQPESELPPEGLRLLSTSEAVETRARFRRLAPIAADDAPPPRNDPNYLFDPHWIPIIGTSRPAVVAAYVSCDEPASRVLYVDWSLPEVAIQMAKSLGQVVEWLTDAWRRGVYIRNEDGDWETDLDRVARDRIDWAGCFY